MGLRVKTNAPSVMEFVAVIMCVTLATLGCRAELKVSKSESTKTAQEETQDETQEKAPSSSPFISIDQGLVTEFLLVDLTLSAVNATRMQISNTENCTAGSWEEYSTSKSDWAHGGIDTSISISVKFKNDSGAESSCATAAITHQLSTPSAPGSINDGNSYGSLSESPTISWTPSSSPVGISHYEVGIGTSQGATDTFAWANVGDVSSHQISAGISLTNGNRYYASVRAVDSLNNPSLTGEGNGWITGAWAGTKLGGVASKVSVIYALALDASGNVLAHGKTSGNLHGETFHGGSYDSFLAKRDALGTYTSNSLFGGAAADATASEINVAANGDIFLTGSTNADIEGQTMTGHFDLFITKVVSGTPAWTKLLGVSSKTTAGYDVVSDSDGNSYVSGLTTGNLDGESLSDPSAAHNAFITKFNSAGNVEWTRLAGGGASSSTMALGIAIDGSNNIYIFGGSTGLDGETIVGAKDGYLMKYNTSGARLWTKTIGVAAATVQPAGISTDESGNIYLAGHVNQDLHGEILTGVTDVFLIKYDSAGSRKWTKLLGTAGTAVTPKSLDVNNSGEICVSGNTNGDLDGNALTGSQDAFVTRFDTSGTKQWTKLLGVAAGSTYGEAVTFDGQGGCYIAGMTNGNLDGEAKTGSFDYFITLYNSAGVKQ